MNNKQKLGIKVFYYYLSRKTTIGIFVLVASIIASSFKQVLVLKLAFLIPLNTSAVVISYIINGLFIASVLLIISAALISWIHYISCDFALDENALNIRRGFLTKREVSIPYRQIQNINIEQSLGQKMMGIGKLVVLTEGDRGIDNTSSEGVFEIIDYVVAHQIREFILQRANLQITKDIEPQNEVVSQ